MARTVFAECGDTDCSCRSALFRLPSPSNMLPKSSSGPPRLRSACGNLGGVAVLAVLVVIARSLVRVGLGG